MSVRFDAATDRIERTTAPTIASTGFTFVAWVYLSADRNENSTMMRLAASGSTRANLATDVNGETLAYFTTGGSIVSTTVMAVGNWYKVAISIPSTGGTTATASLYTATAAGATATGTGTVSANNDANNVCIGGRGAGDATEWFNGRVAYARMWQAALSKAEVEAEWASAVPVRTANLWADWPLLSASDLTDHSGNGRDLTAGSTAVTTEADPPVGSTVTQSITDDAGRTDGLSAALSRSRTLDDSAGSTDVISRSVERGRGFSDDGGLSDALSAALTRGRDLTDSVGLADSIVVTRTRNVIVTDMLRLSDSIHRPTDNEHSTNIVASVGVRRISVSTAGRRITTTIEE